MYKFGQMLFVIDECGCYVEKCVYISQYDEPGFGGNPYLHNIVTESIGKVLIMEEDDLYETKREATTSLVETLGLQLETAKKSLLKMDSTPKVHQLFEKEVKKDD